MTPVRNIFNFFINLVSTVILDNNIVCVIMCTIGDELEKFNHKVDCVTNLDV